MVKKVFAIVFLLVVLVGAYFAYNNYLSTLPIRSQVESCLERYTSGDKYSLYEVELTRVQGSTLREAITNEQVSCVGARLGFAEVQIATAKFGTDGRIDNENYAMLWESEVLPTCDTRKWGCTAKGEPRKTLLKITFKDYR